MELDDDDDWPRRTRMPELAELDAPTREAVVVAVELLRGSLDEFAERYLRLARAHIRAYDVLDDDEIRASAKGFMSSLVAELESFRIPDRALRERLEGLALRRSAQGVPIETLARSYQLGSREMLAVMDEVSAVAKLPADFLLAVHDSTWEFANEAAAVFARVQHDVAVERARFDAERRANFTRELLAGALGETQIDRDAHLFGLDPRQRYVSLATRPRSLEDADASRRAIASALHVAPDRLLFAEIGPIRGGIVPAMPTEVGPFLAGAAEPVHLTDLSSAFEDAVLALETAEVFGLGGVVRLADLGPKPLVSGNARIAGVLESKHFAAFDTGALSSEVEETVRVLLDCDQDVRAAAARLTVHANTVRYRLGRFHEATGLDVGRTEDLVTAWWLLQRRRGDRRRAQ